MKSYQFDIRNREGGVFTEEALSEGPRVDVSLVLVHVVGKVGVVSRPSPVSRISPALEFDHDCLCWAPKEALDVLGRWLCRECGLGGEKKLLKATEAHE